MGRPDKNHRSAETARFFEASFVSQGEQGELKPVPTLAVHRPRTCVHGPRVELSGLMKRAPARRYMDEDAAGAPSFFAGVGFAAGAFAGAVFQKSGSASITNWEG